ncbi:uncharacterized protein [Heptranchias perlo]|uniref:uncharacterized protein n=1 Tax=Heptranchias perlo TaxID=212740 RepID=UPI00355A5B45
MGNQLLRGEQAPDASVGPLHAQGDPAAGGRGPSPGDSPVSPIGSHRLPDPSPDCTCAGEPAESSPAQLPGAHPRCRGMSDGESEGQSSGGASREGGGDWERHQDLEDALQELRSAQEVLQSVTGGQAHRGQLDANAGNEFVERQDSETSPTHWLQGQPGGGQQWDSMAVLQKCQQKLEAVELNLTSGLRKLDCGKGRVQGSRGGAREQDGAGGPPSSSSSSPRTRSGRTASGSGPTRPQEDIVPHQTVPQGEIPTEIDEVGDRLSILATVSPLRVGQSVRLDTQEQREDRRPGKERETPSALGSHALVYRRHFEEGGAEAEGLKGTAALLEDEESRQQAARAIREQETVSQLRESVEVLTSERDDLKEEVKNLKQKMKVGTGT